MRRAEARQRARRMRVERERIRYEEHRRYEERRFEGRAHLSRDTVHLRRRYAVDRAEPEALPPTSALDESAANIRPFSESVALHIHWGNMPTPLRGSLALLERQDERLKADGLKRIETEAQLSESIEHKQLVPIPESSGLSVNGHLEADHRYCRPWTARFLEDLARAHETSFHRPLEVTSAVRPATYQAHLERINGNAAPAMGNVFSPHMMGATIDIGKHGLSRREIAWMRINLLALEEAGKIDVEEEFHQACFHITVYPNYAPELKGSPATAAHTAPAPAASGPRAHGTAEPADADPIPNPDAGAQKDIDTNPLAQEDASGN